MSSQRRILASRANGAKSRGPKTAEAKRRSTAHNTHHGLLASTVVLPDEDPQSFADLHSAMERDLKPQNPAQRALVESMAVSRWRILRFWAIERSTLETEMRKHDRVAGAPAARAALAFRTLSDESRILDLLHRYETRFDRQYARSLTLLLDLQAEVANPPK